MSDQCSVPGRVNDRVNVDMYTDPSVGVCIHRSRELRGPVTCVRPVNRSIPIKPERMFKRRGL